jgi:hypothetical protein
VTDRLWRRVVSLEDHLQAESDYASELEKRIEALESKLQQLWDAQLARSADSIQETPE